MLQWILIRTSRILDWGMVVLVVFALVYICQKLVTILDPPSKGDSDAHDNK